jgi:hypothetical protein
LLADQVRTVLNGPPPLDLSAVVRVMEFLGHAPDDPEERFTMLIKLKTIHQVVTNP